MPTLSFCSTRSALWVLVLGPLLGCFNVELVDVQAPGPKPPPRLIDDFNDGDRQPKDASFEPWRCFGRNGTVQLVRCDAAEGIHGAGSRALTFDLYDFANGERDYQGAELQTRAVEAVDFSLYERFKFSAALESNPAAPPGRTPILVRLYCSALGNGLVDETWVETEVLWVEPKVEPDPDWYTYGPFMTSFEQPPWQKEAWQKENRPLLDEASCLTRVDAVGFFLQPILPDGKRSAGTVSVDDVYVQ
jgi:hypothetical protein